MIFKDLPPSFPFEKTSRRNPLYIIQEPEPEFEECIEKDLKKLDEEKDCFPILLGPDLLTTSIAVGKVLAENGGAYRIHIKNDGHGIQLAGVNLGNPFDAAGSVGGYRKLSEKVHLQKQKTTFHLSPAWEGTKLIERAFTLDFPQVDRPTLVIYRNTLATIQPKLLGENIEADPQFCKDPFLDLVMLKDNFSELIARIMREIGVEHYMLIEPKTKGTSAESTQNPTSHLSL